MKNHIRTAVLGFAFAVVSVHPAAAQPADTGEPESVWVHFLDISGLGACLDATARSMREILEGEMWTIHQEAADELTAVFEEAFAEEVTYREGFSYVMSEAATDTLEQVVAWLNTPLGAEIVSLEKAALDLDDGELERYFETVDAEDEAFITRVKLAARMLELCGGLESALQLSDETWLLVSDGLESIAARDSNRDLAYFVMGLKEAGEFVRAQMPLIIITRSVYTYRDASVEELEAYLDFLETPAGQWYCRVSREAAQAILHSGLARVKTAITERYRIADL